MQECSFCISFRHAGTQGRYDCYFVVCNVAVDICTDEDDFEVGTEIAFGATRSSKVGAVWDYERRIASTYLPWKMLHGIHKTKGGFLTTSHIQVEGVRKARQEYQPSKAMKFKKYSLLDVNAQNLGEQLRESTPENMYVDITCMMNLEVVKNLCSNSKTSSRKGRS